MGNVIYDFMPSSRINPFVGLGVGVARVDVKTLGQFSAVPAGQTPYQNLSIDDNDTVFAYQGLAGLAWQATDRLSVDLTYRMLGTASAEVGLDGLRRRSSPAPSPASTSDSSLTLGRSLCVLDAAGPAAAAAAASPASAAASRRLRRLPRRRRPRLRWLKRGSSWSTSRSISRSSRPTRRRWSNRRLITRSRATRPRSSSSVTPTPRAR